MGASSSSGPEGTVPIPHAGNLLDWKEDVMLHKHFMALRDQHGPVFTYSLGEVRVVVLSDYDSIKEALVTHGNAFAGRPQVIGYVDEKFKCFIPNYPILGITDGSYCDEWKRQRVAAVQILHKLGVGKAAVEEKISRECETLRDLLADMAGGAVNPGQLLNVSVANLMLGLLYGVRFDHSDPEVGKLLEATEKISQLFDEQSEAEYLPSLKYRRAYKKHIASFKKYCDVLNDFNRVHIKAKKERLQQEGLGEPRDFIEYYLKLRLDQRTEASEEKLTENRLPAILNDLMLAGAETSSITLRWCLAWMVVEPRVQTNIHAELDRVIGREPHRFRVSDRANLPYLQATIMEVQRVSASAPLSLSHATTEDVNFRGYHIPANTEVNCNLYGALMDPSVWPEPEKCKPERFLDENGEIMKHPQWIPFSMGRRSCMGEQLAKQELFLFFATLMHSFSIVTPDGSPPPDMTGDSSTYSVFRPLPYEVAFIPRL